MNPYRRKCRSLTQISIGKAVDIPRSVNSIILDHIPLGGQLLVASRLEKASRTENVKAYNTTLLPNIPGLLGMVTLIFAPMAELRIKRDAKRGGLCYYVSGMLAGMGAVDYETHLRSDGVADKQVDMYDDLKNWNFIKILTFFCRKFQKKSNFFISLQKNK